MSPLLISAAVGILIFVAVVLIAHQHMASDEDRRKKTMIERISQETERSNLQRVQDISVLKERNILQNDSFLTAIPGVRSTFNLILKAGLQKHLNLFLGSAIILFVIIAVAAHNMVYKGVPIGLIAAFIIACYVPRWYLRRRIAKRNEQFLNLFPDAIDMIIRSIRSGHPLNTAMRMISENMDNPLRDEFKQVVDEVSYGRSLSESLTRLSKRIDEQDVHFFVVVLAVQQETGGSLAEVLSNLSGVIRKRRQLRLKIRALTSEGRATSYILGALPAVEILGLYVGAPEYLWPLFHTTGGNIIFGTAVALIFAALYIVHLMIQIDI